MQGPAQETSRGEDRLSQRRQSGFERPGRKGSRGSYYRARYYDPATGRFLGEDPLEFDSGELDFYTYVGNNPVEYLDPFGLKCITKVMLVTAYSDQGPGSDWPYYAPKRRGGKPGSVGPGTIAVANTLSPPYAYGPTVTVSGNSDPFFTQSGDPFNLPAYWGVVHDTGAGWDAIHQNVAPDDWIDIWLPHKQAVKWGRQWRSVTICSPDDGCKPK